MVADNNRPGKRGLSEDRTLPCYQARRKDCQLGLSSCFALRLVKSKYCQSRQRGNCRRCLHYGRCRCRARDQKLGRNLAACKLHVLGLSPCS